MKRYSTKVGDHTYLIDLLDRMDGDGYTSYKEYVIFRNSVITNDTILDSDIYFVEKDLVDDGTLKNVCWPNTNSSSVPIVCSSPTYFTEGLNSIEVLQRDAFKLYDGNLQEKSLATMKIRVWHPTTKIDNSKMIVYASSYINSVKFHWVCKKIDTSTSNANGEVRFANGIFTEYYDIEIPDFRDILMNDTWLPEVSNIKMNDVIDGCVKFAVEDELGIMEYTPEVDEDGNNIYHEGTKQFTNMVVYSGFWKYTEGNGKEYVDVKNSILDDVLLNVSLIPYTKLNDNTNIYELDTDLSVSTVSFQQDVKFTLSARLGFVDGQISIIGEFNWCEYLGNLQEAWQKCFNTDFSKYQELANKIKEDPELIDSLGFEENSTDMVKFTCTIASDNNMKNVLYTESRYANEVDNFSIPLHDLLTSWNQVPEMMLIQLKVEDRYIGTSFKSPIIPFTKEKLKYVINDQRSCRATGLLNKQLEQTYNTIDEMNPEYFNFISKLQCSIIRKEDTTTKINKQSNSPRIIYKPIFFKTQDSNTVTLRSGLSQNIGIQLNDYLTKVDKFVIKFGDYTTDEIARNGIYVIFKVDMTSVVDTTGTYDIITSDGDYVTSGSYSIV